MTTPLEHTAIPTDPSPARPRKVDQVPFVEMINGRLQGVVSSDSDIARVYCAFLEAETGNYYSSTNNNRPDAGTPKRIGYLVKQAVVQFGEEEVQRFLRLKSIDALGQKKVEPAAEVFSRFLNYLRFVERKAATGPVPEMDWFLS